MFYAIVLTACWLFVFDASQLQVYVKSCQFCKFSPVQETFDVCCDLVYSRFLQKKI